jgi:cobalt/nickel transport system permease protein
MVNIRSKITDIDTLERLSGRDSRLHKLHPGAKLFGTAVFIAAVVSVDRFALGRLMPFVFYPVVLMALSNTPYRLVLKRLLVCLPFCAFAGASALFLERATVFMLGGMAVSAGTVVFLAILLRACLLVSAVLSLVAVTPFTALTAQLRRIHVPEAFVLLFEMIYRYIGLLSEEAAGIALAYRLRSPRRKGIDLRHAGGFAGGLLLRSFDRADRIYAAMKLRGYPPRTDFRADKPLGRPDYLFCGIVLIFCACLRFL